MAFNKKTHLRQNIDALKTAFTLDRERRAPTPEEERTLGAYSGFGAIKEVLENPTGKPDKDGMATLVAELHEVSGRILPTNGNTSATWTGSRTPS